MILMNISLATRGSEWKGLTYIGSIMGLEKEGYHIQGGVGTGSIRMNGAPHATEYSQDKNDA